MSRRVCEVCYESSEGLRERTTRGLALYCPRCRAGEDHECGSISTLVTEATVGIQLVCSGCRGLDEWFDFGKGDDE